MWCIREDMQCENNVSARSTDQQKTTSPLKLTPVTVLKFDDVSI